MAETLSNGVIIPQGTDTIDSSGVAAMRTMGTSVNAVLGTKASTEDVDAAAFYRGTLPAGTNVDTLYEQGAWYTGNTANTTSLAGTLGVLVPSTFTVIGSGTQFATTQIQVPVTADASGFWYRTRRSSSVWSEWVDLAATGGDPSTAPATSDSHTMRVQAFKDAYPLVSTGGKGVVVLRFDHGLTNFKSTIWPLLQQYNVRAYVAMNSRLWGIDENAGATQADAQAWIASGLVEFGNHTADHEDKNTADGIYDTIVNGRLELEQQLGTRVHGFTVPGVSGYNQLEGFGTGTLDTYSSTYAGGLILANHAIASGAISQPGTGTARRVLDGTIRQGGRHYTFEAASWADIKQQIDDAASTKSALTLMAHPRTMGTAGYWTPALADQVIAYIRSLINAGTLADVSYYQSHRAQLDPLPGYKSGLRDVASLLTTGFTAFQARAMRSGDTVTVHLVNLAYSGGSTGTITAMNLPPGFRPPATAPAYTTRGQLAQITTSGVVQIASPTASVTSVMFSYLTTEQPPASPPGTAV